MAQGPLEVESSAILDLAGSYQFMSHPHWLCESFKDCALTPSFLSRVWESMGAGRDVSLGELKNLKEIQPVNPQGNQS